MYELQYTGTCLDTATFPIEIFPLPPFSVTTLPGEIVCVEDEISIEFDYQGTSQIDSCALFDNFGNSLTSNGTCTWTLLPENLGGPYTAILSDNNACVNEQEFNIDIQQQPFTFSCLGMDTTYCDNSTDVIYDERSG